MNPSPRRFEYVRLSDEEIAQVIRLAFPHEAVVDASLIQQGGINTNYRVALRDQASDLALRIIRRGEGTPAKELALLTAMRDVVPVPEVFYAETEANTLDHPFMITSWLPGRTLAAALEEAADDDRTQAALGAEVGRVLGRIAHRRFDAFGMLQPDLSVLPWGVGSDSHDDGGNGSDDAAGASDEPESVSVGFIRLFLGQYAGRHLGADKSGRLMAMVKRNAALFNGSPTAHLVHSDFNATNILVDHTPQGWKVTGVLDWEWAHAGTPIFDIANLLRWEEVTRPPFQESFAEGFQSVGEPLPPNWHDRALLTDLLNLLEMLNTPSALHSRQQRMLERVEKTLEHFGG